MSKRVFVTQEDPKKDLSKASRYGQINILLPLTQVTFDASFVVERLSEKLADFDPLNDHLLLLGDPVLISIATAIVSRNTEGFFSVLKWDRFEHNYNSVTIDLGVEDE